jgi:hypothetical protein
MVRQTDDDERAKAERLLDRLEEKDSKMRKKWVDKIARAWRKEGKLKSLYIVDALGKGRELVRGYHGFLLLLGWDYGWTGQHPPAGGSELESEPTGTIIMGSYLGDGSRGCPCSDKFFLRSAVTIDHPRPQTPVSTFFRLFFHLTITYGNQFRHCRAKIHANHS